MLAITAGLLITAGLFGIVYGMRQQTRVAGTRRQSPGQLWAKITRRAADQAGRRRDLILLGSLITGFVVAMLTGWLILIVILPALALGPIAEALS